MEKSVRKIYCAQNNIIYSRLNAMLSLFWLCNLGIGGNVANFGAGEEQKCYLNSKQYCSS